METEQNKKKVGNFAIFIMVFFAIVADILSLIPFVGTVTGPVFWAGVNFYLWKAGFGLINAKRMITSGLSMLAEVIPAIQFLPFATVGVIVMISIIKIEEKTGISITPLVGKGGTGSRAPLNHGGTRLPTNQIAQTSTQPLNIDGVRAPN